MIEIFKKIGYWIVVIVSWFLLYFAAMSVSFSVDKESVYHFICLWYYVAFVALVLFAEKGNLLFLKRVSFVGVILLLFNIVTNLSL